MARCLLATLFIPPDDPLLEPLRADGHEVAAVDSISVRTEAALIDALQGMAASLASIEPYSAAVLAETPDLRVISRIGVGYDAIDVAEATRRGIVVCTTPGANHHSVADLAVGLILMCLRQIVPAAEIVRAGNWAPQRVGVELRATTVGIVGTGLIGREVVKRLSGFEPRVLAYDIVESPEMVQRYGVEYVSFEELLRHADVLTLHAPLLPETRGLIDADALARMKPSAYVVNTARGPLVDEVAIARALHAGQIAGAALDVFDREPLPAASPLRQAPNLILTPHIAGVTQQSRTAMVAMAVQNVARVLRGEAPLSCVNPEVLARAAR
ncbi:MAG TPA: phosphoglycerate dehydrogenase [Chloroflexota bacterium]|nr:phosphoglycerate dehydrogenase [Chloroflexota bacterium]